MKRLILLLLLSNFVLANSVINISFYDRLFNDLAKKRVGLSESDINNLKNPFPIVNEVKENSESGGSADFGYTLNGIFGDRVKINDSWYKIGDDVDNFKLKNIEVEEKSVILVNDTQEIKLKLKKGNKNVIITFK